MYDETVSWIICISLPLKSTSVNKCLRSNFEDTVHFLHSDISPVSNAISTIPQGRSTSYQHLQSMIPLQQRNRNLWKQSVSASAYCLLFADSSASFPANLWECQVGKADRHAHNGNGRGVIRPVLEQIPSDDGHCISAVMNRSKLVFITSSLGCSKLERSETYR